VRGGQSLDEIISRESLSESEIRLHLGLSAVERAPATTTAAPAEAAPRKDRATEAVHDRSASRPAGARLTRVPLRRKEVPCPVVTTQP
jgi:hypothetical protein